MAKQDILLIDYTACNWDSLLLLMFIMPFMVCLVIILKTISFGEYYHSQNIPVPIFFHFGDTRMVKNLVEQIIDAKRTGKSITPDEGFESNSKSKYETGKYYSIQDIIGDISAVVDKVKRFFMRINTNIMGINNGATTLYEDGREKIISDSMEINGKVFTDFIEPLWRKNKP